MRTRIVAALAVLVLTVALSAPANAAPAALKQQKPSSDLPWVIGIVVLLALAAVAGWLFLKRPRTDRADRRDEPGGWS